MARFCVVVTLAVCCLVTGSNSTGWATRECSVERSGVLTMFNGQTSTVAVPCKYRLADIQCGDYQLVVTPGSKLDSDNTFSPVTLSVKILKSGPEEKLTVRTSSSRLKKLAEERVDNPWLQKKGDLSSFGLDLADYDSAKQAAVLRKKGVFEVEFSADQAGVAVRCFSDSFSSKPQPDTLCGDGVSGNSTTEEEILDMVFTNTFVLQRQSNSCPDAASVYQQCAAGASVTRDCDYIFLENATVDCLAGSGSPLIVHYVRCLKTACGVDTSAMDPTLAYISDSCADWLNSTCSADGDCPAARNSTCFEGLCLCTPGYYYSVGQKTCVEECAEDDLQETFLKYPGSFITSFIIADGVRDDEGSCMEWCRSVTECRAAGYHSSYSDCLLESKTSLGVPVSEWITGDSSYSRYQKMCA